MDDNLAKTENTIKIKELNSIMKQAKRFFIALLSFCLLGNMLAKADVTDDGFVYTEYSKLVRVTGYTGTAKSLVFPKINGKSTVIDKNFCQGVSNVAEIEEIDLTNVSQVLSNAFVVYEDYDWESGDLYTFGFVNLKRAVIGDGITVNAGAFSGTTITELAFSGNTASNVSEFASTVTTVDLSSVTTIGDGAFQGFAQLHTIENFENVTSIGSSAFSGCTGLTSIDLSNVTSIGTSAFRGCTGLTSIDLSNVNTIGAFAFQNCGDAVSKMGLREVVWPEDLTVFPASVFSGCAMLNSVTNLDKATEFGACAFYNCSSLGGSYEFSNTLKSVGEDAFMGTKVTSVVFKSNPTIETNAFLAAVALNLVIEDKVDFLNESVNVFDNVAYERTFTAGKFASLVLPFVPEQVKSGELEIFELKEARENDCLVFGQVPASEFRPGVPYLVKATMDISVLTCKNAEVKCDMANTTLGDWTMIGQYERLELIAANAPVGRRYYYYTSANGGQSSANGGQFLYATGTLGVSPFRTYIEGPIMSGLAGVRMMTRGFEGEETAIDVVELEDLFAPAGDVYYDLNGRRVLAPIEGNMYIVNGKKFVF